MMRATLVVLVACAKPPPPPPPVLTNERVGAPEEKLPPNCEMPARLTARLDGELTRVALIECVVRERAENEEQKEAGMLLRDRSAELVWRRRTDEATQRFTLKEWTDGWEWGASVYFVGVLEATRGTNDAVVIQENSWDTGVGMQRAVIYTLRGRTWARLEEVDGESFELAKDGRSLRVVQCEFSSTVAQTPDVVCDDTTGTVTKIEVRWDGTAVSRAP